jgi:hypothetical protein
MSDELLQPIEETKVDQVTTKPAEEVLYAEADEKQKAKEEVKEVSPEGAEAPKEEVKEEVAKTEEKKEDEKFSIKLPEGALLDNTAVERIAADAKAQGLSEKQAQWLVERENALLKAQTEAIEAKKTEWLELSKADKEIGGANLPKHAELARRVIEKFGSQDFKKMMNESGMGNHPEAIRFIAKIGKAMADDEFVLGAKQPPKQKSAAEVLYGSGD